LGLACEYARGKHDDSAMDDMTTWAHPLGWSRINVARQRQYKRTLLKGISFVNLPGLKSK
jgi:hypothetical protein